MKDKKKTTLCLGTATTLLAMMISDKYTTEIAIIGFTITMLAGFIVENLSKEK